MTDPISDMLTRIRNAIMVQKKEVVFPYSKIKLAVSKMLEKEKKIDKVVVIEPTQTLRRRKNNSDSQFKQIKIILKYDNNRPVINTIKRISRPGQKIYIKHNEIRQVKNGFGLAIISTSRGLMTDQEAKRKKVGGEIICEIW